MKSKARTTIKLAVVTPRNPLVAAAHAKSGAGSHQKSRKTQRRSERVQFKKEWM
jgi:hypothetical protein